MRKLFFIGIFALVGAFAVGAILLNGDTHSAAGNESQQEACSEFPNAIHSDIVSIWSNTDFCNTIYPAEEFLIGQRRDGIPPIYPPGYTYPEDIPGLGGLEPSYTVAYQSIQEGDVWLEDQSPVISVEINDDARAYPLGILTRHEIANTEIGGEKVAVTFCPLCNTGVAFQRVLNGQELHFGVSGLLRNSDLVMWDNETESWWQQATGEGIVGELAGEQLQFVTSAMVSWGDFKAEHPNGQVLAPPRGDGQQYNYNPYAGYDNDGGRPFLYRGETDDRLLATERVLTYVSEEDVNRIAVAYPFATLAEEVVVNDVVNGQPVAIFWQPGATSALDQSDINESREVGSATMFIPELEDGTLLTFSADGTTIIDDQTESSWNIFGRATSGELEGTQLEQTQAFPHFWFAHFAFYPDTLIWETGVTTDELAE